MGEEGQTQNTGTGGDGGAWRTELPEPLRGHEAFAPYSTKSDLWQGVAKLHDDHKATVQKVTDIEGKLKDAIPKLPENATQEERDVWFNAMGRPEKPEGYELDGDGKNAPEWTNFWKSELHKIGLSKDTAKALSVTLNTQIAKMVEAHNASIQAGIADSALKLKTEWGDQYDKNVELAQRMWKTHTDGDLDAAFKGETSANRFQMLRFLTKMAKLTGEDGSPQGGPARGTNAGDSNQWFPNSPKSPTGK